MTLPTILRSARLQVRVVGALLLRELHTRFGRENIGFLWLVAEPGLFCLGVTLMWGAIKPAHEHGVPVVAFVITGYVPLTMWRHCVFRAVKAFEANGSLLFHRQVTPLDIILARVVLEVYGTIIAGLLVSIAAMLLGFMDPPADIGLVYLGTLYHVAFCLACALLFASLSERSEMLEKFVSVFTYLAIPFSGAFAMVDWLPQSFHPILYWSPSVHSVEMIRAGQFGSKVHAHYDLAFMTWINAALLLIGLSLTLRSRRYIVVQ